MKTKQQPPVIQQAEVRESRLYSIQVRERQGETTDSFYVEGLDLADAALRANAIAEAQSTVDCVWEVEGASFVGAVRRIWPKLGTNGR
jgi:hypothetical protein